MTLRAGPPKGRGSRYGAPTRLAPALIIAFALLLSALPQVVTATAHSPQPVVGQGPPAVFHSAASDNLSGAWTSLGTDSDQPFARTGAALSFDRGQGLGVLFGGRDGPGNVLNDTWVNDGDFPGKWVEPESGPGLSPPALYDAGLTYDTAVDAFVLFGGTLSNGSGYGGTWEFADFHWIELTGILSFSPPPDRAPAMAFDPLAGQVVLLSSADPAATWLFGAGGWTRTTPTPAPPPRSAAAAAWDDVLGGVLVFGGQSAGTDPQPFGDSWTYDSAGWHRINGSAAPPAEAHPMMAFDPRIPGVLLLDEVGGAATWTLTASGWTAGSPALVSPQRPLGALYYDANTGYDIQFGGTDANGTVQADEWGWSVPPPFQDPTLGAASVPVSTWIEVGAIVALPIAIALLLRRRPPRSLPTDAPATAPNAAVG
ncbi:MAG: hypothetical protein L3K06_04900 [Thermoplasmata archaeon]|nr:hypothetical protein [Thermoplasmata archaeon]